MASVSVGLEHIKVSYEAHVFPVFSTCHESENNAASRKVRGSTIAIITAHAPGLRTCPSPGPAAKSKSTKIVEVGSSF